MLQRKRRKEEARKKASVIRKKASVIDLMLPYIYVLKSLDIYIECIMFVNPLGVLL